MRALLFFTSMGIVACGSDKAVKAFNNDPTASITSHADGDEVIEGVVTTFRGSVSDANHDTSSLTATWFAGTEEICPSTPPEDDGTVLCEATIGEDVTEITLEVKDPNDAAGAASVAISVVNPAPEVEITSHDDGDSLTEGDLITLVGSATDANHEASELVGTWYTGTDVLCEEATLSEEGESSCEFVLTPDDTEITFEVEDADGEKGEDSLTFNVILTESPEAMIISPEVAGVYYSDQLIVFEGIVSDTEDDADTLIASWESNLDGELDAVDAEPNADGEVLGYGYLTEGEHAIELHVEDASGKTGTDSVIINVGPPNSAPLCEITTPETGSAGAQGDTVSFTATASDVDVSADWLSVEWSSDKDGSLGNSVPSSAGEVLFSFADLSVNTHTITLTVTDEVGATCTDFVSYTVGTPPSITIDSPTNGNTYSEGEALSFAATVSDGQDNPDEVSLSWDVNGTVISTQGATSSGTAQFTDATLAAGSYTLTVTATDTDGLTDNDQLSFTINGLPTSPSVSISPDPAYTTDQLTATASGSTDPEGATVSYSYEWLKNGVLTSNTSSVVASSETSSGEVWTVRVTPNDGIGDGPSSEASITISNSEPSLSVVTIIPATGVYNDTSLTCSATASDADETLTVAYEWSINSNVIASGDTLDLSGVAANPTDSVTCSASVTDSEGASASDSASVSIENRAPSISSVSITPNTGVTTSTLLTCSATSDDTDGETLTVAYEWTLNGTSLGTSESLSLDNSMVSPADAVVCTVSVSDGYGSSASDSTSVTVENTNPVVDSVVITPDSGVVTGSELTCISTFSDADGDTPTATYVWTVNGNQIGSGTTYTVSEADTDVGDDILCEVTIADADGGSASDSASVTLENTAPVVDSVSISPDPAYNDGTLTCTATTSDVDNENLTVAYSWYNPNKADYLGAGSSVTLDFETASPGDTIECTVTVTDESGEEVSSTTSITIGNRVPDTPTVSISPDPAYNDDTLTCSYSASDADEDTLTVTYSWYNPNKSDYLGGDSTADLDFELASPGDTIECTVTVTDPSGEEASSTTSITIGNRSPTVSNVTITPSSGVTTSSTLNCSATVADADEDSLSTTYEWTVGATVLGSSADFTLDPTLISPSDNVVCTVSVSDGYGGSASDSISVTVENTNPVVDSVVITPDSGVVTGSALTCVSTFSDADGDTPTATYTWTVNGNQVGSGTTYTVSEADTDVGDDILCEVTIADADGGSASGSASVTLENTAPVVDSVSIAPDPAYNDETLTCTSTTSDVDNETLTVAYSWYNPNKADYLGAGSSVTLDFETASPGDTIECTVTVTDESGEEASSTTSITIGNRVPDTPTVSISPDPAYNDDTLTCSYSASDADEDTLTVIYSWYNPNKSDYLGGDATADLDFELASPGDTIECTVTVTDPSGEEASSTTSITIGNRSPTVSNVTITPSSGVTTSSTLNCSATVADADEDSLSATYEWTVGATVLGSSADLTLDPASIASGDDVICTVSVSDGYGGSASDSASVTVENTPPVIDTLSLSPSTLNVGTSAVSCDVTGSDADGDTVTFTYEWLVDGAVQAETSNMFSGPFLVGTLIACRTTPNDTKDNGVSEEVSTTVENTAPVVDSVSLVPGVVYTNDTIVATAVLSDADASQATSATYEWHVIDVDSGVDTAVQGGSDNSLDGATHFDRDDEVYVIVTPNDGTDDGAPVTSSSITISNTAPTGITISSAPNPASAGQDDLVCTVVTPASDEDGDAILYTYVWTDGSGTVQQTTSETSATSDTFAASGTSEGVWTCEVTPTDGTEVGLSDSTVLTVENGCGSLSFDGSNDYVELQNHPLVDSSFSHTVEIWFQPNTVNNGVPVWAESWYFQLCENGSTILLEAVTDMCSAMKVGEWNHAVASYDANTGSKRVFLNGIEFSVTNDYGYIGPQGGLADYMFFGMNHTQGNYYDGLISDVRFWSKAFDLADVLAAPTVDPLVESDLMAYWNFSSPTALKDLSGNGYDGVINGATWVNTCPEEDLDEDGTAAWEDCDDDDALLNEDDVDNDGYSTCDGDCDDNDNSITFECITDCNHYDVLTFTGAEQVWDKPYSKVYVKAWGAGGGTNTYSANGGGGGYADAILNVPSDGLTVIVGEGGVESCHSTGGVCPTPYSFGGGGIGNSSHGTGGGYSGVFDGSVSQSNALLIAGGGGGGGDAVNGGAGGGTSGQDAAAGSGGEGGSQTQGGNAGTAYGGSALQGGDTNAVSGGGGGGGYYGGAGGTGSGPRGEGGGGSGYDSTGLGTLTQGNYVTPGNAGDAMRMGYGDGASPSATTGDDGVVIICYDPTSIDMDGDGYTADVDCDDNDPSLPSADDQDCDGVTVSAGDCDDADPTIHPYAGDTYGDGIDSDCDGTDSCEAGDYGGTYFAACYDPMSWQAALTACQNLGYDGLASLLDAGENSYVHGILPVQGSSYASMLWIGFNDLSVEGNFEWASGLSANYTSWSTGEPSNGGGGNEDCTRIHPQNDVHFGFWNDFDCSYSLSYVCEAR